MYLRSCWVLGSSTPGDVDRAILCFIIYFKWGRRNRQILIIFSSRGRKRDIGWGREWRGGKWGASCLPSPPITLTEAVFVNTRWLPGVGVEVGLFWVSSQSRARSFPSSSRRPTFQIKPGRRASGDPAPGLSLRMPYSFKKECILGGPARMQAIRLFWDFLNIISWQIPWNKSCTALSEVQGRKMTKTPPPPRCLPVLEKPVVQPGFRHRNKLRPHWVSTAWRHGQNSLGL